MVDYTYPISNSIRYKEYSGKAAYYMIFKGRQVLDIGIATNVKVVIGQGAQQTGNDFFVEPNHVGFLLKRAIIPKGLIPGFDSYGLSIPAGARWPTGKWPGYIDTDNVLTAADGQVDWGSLPSLGWDLERKAKALGRNMEQEYSSFQPQEVADLAPPSSPDKGALVKMLGLPGLTKYMLAWDDNGAKLIELSDMKSIIEHFFPYPPDELSDGSALSSDQANLRNSIVALQRQNRISFIQDIDSHIRKSGDMRLASEDVQIYYAS